MAIRIAINGFGRIGRSVLRALYETGKNQQIEVVAINELAKPEAIVHLLQFDSSHGRFLKTVRNHQTHIQIDNDKIQLLHLPEISALPWQALNVDIVLDCTGVYGSREHGLAHLKAGAGKVLFSHPGENDLDNTIIYGVNHQSLKASDRLVSNGSCTTNCIVPIIKVLDDAFGIESGTVTTIHSSMNDQPVIDAYHTDLRRTRAASQSIIPVDTMLHIGIGRIFPKFLNKFEAISVRVPTINVSAMDLSVSLHAKVGVNDINQAIRTAAFGTLCGIINYTEMPLVSVDFNHDPHSAIVDGSQTRVSNQRLVKTLVWCDNEWGFANRMLDTTLALAASFSS